MGSGTLSRAILSALILLGLAIGPVTAATVNPGDILVADPGSGTIHHFSASGADLGVFVSGLSAPSWITADQTGNIYVSEYGGARVDKFSPFGVRLLTITTLFTPGGIAVGADGTIYVAHYDAGRVHRYAASGTDLGIFASYAGCETGCGTDFIKFDASGRLYVGDFQPVGRIRLISPTGVDLGDFVTGITGGPEGLAFDAAGNLYVGNYLQFIITSYSPFGSFLGKFATLDGPGPGSAYGFAFDSTGNLYAANYAGGSIHKFSPSGADLGIFASAGLVLPRDVVIVPTGGPVTKDECKDGGWRTFAFPRTFKNQGDCIQFVNTRK